MGVILVPMPIADAGHLAATIFYYFFFFPGSVLGFEAQVKRGHVEMEKLSPSPMYVVPPACWNCRYVADGRSDLSGQGHGKASNSNKTSMPLLLKDLLRAAASCLV